MNIETIMDNMDNLPLWAKIILFPFGFMIGLVIIAIFIVVMIPVLAISTVLIILKLILTIALLPVALIELYYGKIH